MEYCKDCIRAKKRQGYPEGLWFCGKHRKYITPHTLSSLDYEKRCKDYQEGQK